VVIFEDDSVPGETHGAEQTDKNNKSVHRTTSRRKPLQQAWQQDLNIKAIFQKSANWPSRVIKTPNVLMPMNGTILREISTEATEGLFSAWPCRKPPKSNPTTERRMPAAVRAK